MRMTITLVAKGDRPLDGPSAEFDEQGGTIGRRTDCTLVLADEQRHVSRVHALVEFRSDYFCIVDKGSYLPVMVNGMRVGRGQETPIFEGDELHIGPYAMRVTHVAAAWDMDATTVVSELLSRPAAEPAAVTAVPDAVAVAVADIAPESEAEEEPAVSTSDASPDGNTPKKRTSRSRKRARRKEPPLESISDNPSQTHEPRQGMPLEESVARLLAADREESFPGHARGPVAVPAPGVEIAAADDGAGDRPGFSTFDLLADRLQVKGDLAYEPFLPTVWDEIAKGPGGHSPVAPQPEAPAHAAEVVEQASVTDEGVAAAPAEMIATEVPEASAVEREVAQDLLPETLEASAADREDAPPVVGDISDTIEPAQEAAVVERVVRRRRQRTKREESSVVVTAGHAESPMTETPEIVLVLQPVAAAETDSTGRTDDYVIPIRRRNRRPQSAAR